MYSVLVVRIARDELDLTARARIRDAAIECFAEDGFGAPFRTIAGRAGVSPGLITHHFGSKDVLRDECDTEVLRRYRDLKTDAVDHPSAYLTSALTDPGTAPSLLVYLLRAVAAGGPGAARFLDRLVEDMRPVMAHGVATGFLRPSRDEEARLRYLAHQTIGAMLVQFLTTPDVTPAQFVASLSSRPREVVLPMLEVFTEGYIADRTMLDEYVQRLGEPIPPERS